MAKHLEVGLLHATTLPLFPTPTLLRHLCHCHISYPLPPFDFLSLQGSYKVTEAGFGSRFAAAAPLPHPVQNVVTTVPGPATSPSFSLGASRAL